MASRFDFEITGLDFETLLAEAKVYAQSNFPEWKVEDTNDVGWFILETYLRAMGRSNWFINAVAQEFNLFTAKERASVLAHCKKLGYELASAVPYTVSTRLTFQSPGSQVVVPAYAIKASTKNVDNKPVFFENATQFVIDPGLTQYDSTFVEGESKTDTATADGKAYFQVILSNKNAIDGSFVVKVGGVTWTEVEHFVDSGPTDQHYLVEQLEDGGSVVRFGNGVNGAIPPDQSAIEIRYRVVGENRGRILAGKLKTIELNTSDLVLTGVNNLADSSGGADRESIEHAKIYAPLQKLSLERLVTLRDVESYCETLTGVARASAYLIGNVVQISIIPAGGGLPDQSLKNSVQAAVQNLLLMGYSASVVDPDYVTVTVTLNVYSKKGYLESEVQASIISQLNTLFNPLSKDENGKWINNFGETFPLNRIRKMLANMASVRDDFVIVEPTSDIELVCDQIVTHSGSTFNVNVSGSQVKVHYPHFPKEV